MEATDQEILSLYQQFHNGREIARHLNVHPNMVHKSLNRNGISPGKGANNPRKIDRNSILSLYLQYNNTTLVAKHMGCSHTVVHRCLKQMGVQLPHPGDHCIKYHLPMQEVAQRYQSGESTCELAKEFGVDPERIRRRLETMGVKRRSLKDSRARGKKNGFYTNGSTEKRQEDKDMHYYRRQSYEVAAICLGQPLSRGSVIHHVDSDWHNNNPENLVIFPNQKIHAGFHSKLLRLHKKGIQVDAIRLALESGAEVLPRPPAQILL